MEHQETPPSRIGKDLQRRSADRRIFARDLLSVAHLIGAPVVTPDQKRLGRVEDVVARWPDAAAPPQVVGLLTKVGRGEVMVSIADVKLSQSHVEVSEMPKTLVKPELDDAYIVLARQVLDHQIIDTNGVQVVRSSDIYLAANAGGWEVAGIDVGLRALARRLLPRRRTPPRPNRAIDWKEIQPLSDRSAADGPGTGLDSSVRLHHKATGVRTLAASDVADLLRELDRPNQARLVALSNPSVAAEALTDLDPSKRRALLAELDEGDRDHLTAMLPEEVRRTLAPPRS